jgi:membrane protein DedA with SNARE-associated domain
MFGWITGVIERLGYLGVAALTFLENMFPPIPSEVVIPLAGFVSARGALRLELVIAAASIGSMAGTAAWYALGRRIGRPRLQQWVARHGRWITLSPRDVERADLWFRSHGSWAVCLGRMVPGVRTLISLPAGFSAMPLTRFLVYSAIGTLAWTALLAGAGMILQANFERVRDYIDVVSNFVLGIFVVVLAFRYVRCWREASANLSERKSSRS